MAFTYPCLQVVDLDVPPATHGPWTLRNTTTVVRYDLDTDVDRGAPQFENETLTVTVSARHGTVSLNRIAELAFADGTGQLDRRVTFSGRLEDVNRALLGLRYVGDTDWNSHRRRAGDDVAGAQELEAVTITVTDR